MEEEFEEFEEDEDEEANDLLEEPEPVKKPLTKNVIPAKQIPIRKPQPQEVKEIKKAVVREPEPEVEQAGIEPKRKITSNEVIEVFQNHEQRIMALESALFRLKGAI